MQWQDYVVVITLGTVGILLTFMQTYVWLVVRENRRLAEQRQREYEARVKQIQQAAGRRQPTTPPGRRAKTNGRHTGETK